MTPGYDRTADEQSDGGALVHHLIERLPPQTFALGVDRARNSEALTLAD
jgi:hypothetical protein